MIEFKSIKFKNGLQYGNTFTEFNFENGITRIIGANGSGKSSMTDLLYWCLFNKTYRSINLGMLINSLNKKELEVHVIFKIKDTTYKIERGQKPNFLRIFKKEDPTRDFIDTDIIPVPSSTRTYQQILEEDILHMNSSIFEQTILKSLTKDISFLTLPKAQKRDIIENILDIKIFTAMNKITKEKVDALGKTLISSNKDLEYSSVLIQQEKDNLTKLKSINEQIERENKTKSDEIDKEIEALKLQLEPLQKKLELVEVAKQKQIKFQSKYDSVNEKLSTFIEQKDEIKMRQKESQIKYQTLINICSDCPRAKDIQESEQAIDYDDLLNGIDSNISIIEEELQELDIKIQKCIQYSKNESSILLSIENINNNIEQKQKQKNQSTSKIVDIDVTKLKELIENKKNLTSSIEKIQKEKLHLTFIRSMLSDDAIKSFVIKKYLPVINNLLLYYLDKMNSEIRFEFDSEFEEVIINRHKEGFTYHSCSEGQKRRIDLAVLFTFITFCKSKYPLASSNLLILDEITAGLDVDGESNLMDILKDINKNENKSVIFITHSTAINSAYIDKTFEVVVENKFSKMKRIE